MRNQYINIIHPDPCVARKKCLETLTKTYYETCLCRLETESWHEGNEDGSIRKKIYSQLKRLR